MKLIIAIIQPDKLEKVKEELYKAQGNLITVSEVLGHGRQMGVTEIYRGAMPFSEPEAQALRNLMESHNFTLSLSYHSYGDLFFFPWSYIDEDTEDQKVFEKLAQIYTKRNGYIYGNTKDDVIYNTNGDLDDWGYGEQKTKNKVFSVTVEVGDSFQPPGSEISGLIEENLKPAIWMIFAAGRL